MKKLLVALTMLSIVIFNPSSASAAKSRCKPVKKADLTVCINISSSSNSKATARVYLGDEDVFGVFNVSVSVHDTDCAKNVNMKNCGGTGDFITPKGVRYSLCAVDKIPKSGSVCGNRKLAPGLVNVTVFDSPVGAWALHYYKHSGDSHGCGRLVGSKGFEISKYISKAAQDGKTVAVRVLYPNN